MGRMPVILPRGLEGAWLDPELPQERALALLEPYPAGAMLALPASDRVTRCGATIQAFWSPRLAA